MKKIITLLIGLMTFVTSIAVAQDSDIKLIDIKNPSYTNNVQLGDILERTAKIEIDANYQLEKQLLSQSGKNYGGIELRELKVDQYKKKSKLIYTISFRYQVFANSDSPVVMKLPEETILFKKAKDSSTVKIPEWNFWFSPISPATISNLKENLQPQYPPSIINLDKHQLVFFASLTSALIGLLGLIYVNANLSALPLMNGEFARAYRKIKKLKNDVNDTEKALGHMHQAFNTLNSGTLFANDVENFLKRKPEFLPLKGEIVEFFTISNEALFSSKSTKKPQEIEQVRSFCKKLRSCERHI